MKIAGLIFIIVTLFVFEWNGSLLFCAPQPNNCGFVFFERDSSKSDLLLRMKKVKKGIDLSCKYHSGYCNLHIDHPLYSDVIFPEEAVAIIENGEIHRGKYCFLNDSILILPLIGISFHLTVYVVNLNSCRVINEQDIRTVLDHIWISRNNNMFVVAEKSWLADTSMRYNFISYKITQSDVVQTNHYKIDTNEVIDNNFPFEQKISEELLLLK